MKLFPAIVLTILSTLLLGFYALIWQTWSNPPIAGTDSLSNFVNAIGLAGLVLAVMAIRELRAQKKIAMQLKNENEGFV